MLTIPLEFIFFGFTLVGVALLHHHTLRVAVIGMVTISIYKVIFSTFQEGPGLKGLALHLGHEWVTIENLFGLLLGFALLAKKFERSHLPELLPKYLPNDWKGGFVLLVIIFVLSAFLDNIAAALIGGTIAASVFHKKLHIGYLAAIVAASNAGGSGSVVGDTTTTMIWIAGKSPLEVLPAYVGAFTALLFFGYFAARQQQAFYPIQKNPPAGLKIQWGRLSAIVLILISAISANVLCNIFFPSFLAAFPVIGSAVWIAILVAIPISKPDWGELKGATRGAIFLLSLVLAASMMPVEQLPPPSAMSTFGLGFLSAVFDNIPLTALAIRQDGYDWGFLAYAVGFGGSMIWFGSSAGVALASIFPQARSAVQWVKAGWHVIVGYVIGYFAMLLVLGWQQP